MRKLYVIFFFSLFLIHMLSAEVILKVKANTGGVAENCVLKTQGSPIMGGCVDIEWKSKGDWIAHWGYMNTGISVGMLDFNNSKYFGQNYRIMPYVLLPFSVDNKVNFGVKIGAGLSYYTRTSVLNGAHFAPLMEIGMFGELKMSRRFYLLGELNIDGLNTMAIRIPSPSIAAGFASIGVKMRLGHLPKERRARYIYVPNNPVCSEWNFSLTGGVIDYSTTNDDFKPVGSFHVDYQRFVTSVYSTGVGMLVSFNNKYGEQGVRGHDIHINKTTLNEFYIPEEKLSNKIKVGVDWDNTFVFGRFSYLVNIGVYLIDPIRNAYSEETDRGVFYNYDFYKTEGFLYARLGFRYRLYEGLALEANVNTFAGIFDTMQLGINYTIPFVTKYSMRGRHNFSSLKIYKYDK